MLLRKITVREKATMICVGILVLLGYFMMPIAQEQLRKKFDRDENDRKRPSQLKQPGQGS